MSQRSRPPFRADHVGSLLRPPALLAARERGGERRDLAGRTARRRGRGDPRGRRLPGGARPAKRHRRRVPPHLLPHRLPGAVRGDRGLRERHRRPLPPRGRRPRLRPAAARDHRQAPPAAVRSSARTSRSSPPPRARTPKIDHPLAQHGPLPRRPRGGGPDAPIPKSRPSSPTSPGSTPRRSPTWRRAAAATCSSTTPTSPTCAIRSSAPTSRPWARTRTRCRPPTRD